MTDLYGVRRRSILGEAWFWIVAVLVTILLVTVAVVAVRTALAPASGAAGAFRQKQSANNRIQKQEMFEQLNADIDAYVIQIATAEVAVKAAADAQARSLRQVELLGLQQQCVSTVQQYNAESRKYTARDFRSADLPFTRDPAECQGGAS